MAGGRRQGGHEQRGGNGHGRDDRFQRGGTAARANVGGRVQGNIEGHLPPPPPPPPPPVVQQQLLDEDDILYLGLSLVGFQEHRHKAMELRVRRFRAFFGVSPKALSSLYNDLSNIMDKRNPSHFLMAINWLKLYDSEHVLAGRWSLNEDTIRINVRNYVSKIQQLKQTKVQWGGFDDEEIFIISVDGVHCRITEVRKDPGAKWYSHKFNASGVSYELGIAVRSNRLVWINGPFPASEHDVTIFRRPTDPENGLKALIPDGKRAIGDSGYRGEPSKVAVTRDGDSGEVKGFKARVKSRHETFNSRIKSFNVLDHAFRHGFDQHKKCFEAVCICVQFDIENGNGLFEV